MPSEYRTYGTHPHGMATRSHSRGPACLQRAHCRAREEDGNQPAVSLFLNLLWNTWFFVLSHEPEDNVLLS